VDSKLDLRPGYKEFSGGERDNIQQLILTGFTILILIILR